jgi:hypothetical protein
MTWARGQMDGMCWHEGMHVHCVDCFPCNYVSFHNCCIACLCGAYAWGYVNRHRGGSHQMECVALCCTAFVLHCRYSCMHVSYLNCCVQFSCTVSVTCMPGCYVNRHRDESQQMNCAHLGRINATVVVAMECTECMHGAHLEGGSKHGNLQAENCVWTCTPPLMFCLCPLEIPPFREITSHCESTDAL